MSECWLKIGDFAPTGPVNPKFQVEGVAPTNRSSSQKTRLSDISYIKKIWTRHSFVLSQITRVAGVLFSSLDRVCIPYSAVKMNFLCQSFWKLSYFGHTDIRTYIHTYIRYSNYIPGRFV